MMVTRAASESESACPPGEVVDLLRLSYTAMKWLAEQEQFAADLEKVGGEKKKLRRFIAVRLKSTHADTKADVKQTIVNYRYTPFCGVTGSKPQTFNDMVTDPAFEAVIKARLERDDIPVPVVEAALELLRHKKIAAKPISMVIEVQFYVDAFLTKRKLVHIFYKVFRTQSALELVMDFAKYANGEGESAAMAYNQPAPTMTAEYATLQGIAEAKKRGLKLGVSAPTRGC